MRQKHTRMLSDSDSLCGQNTRAHFCIEICTASHICFSLSNTSLHRSRSTGSLITHSGIWLISSPRLHPLTKSLHSLCPYRIEIIIVCIVCVWHFVPSAESHFIFLRHHNICSLCSRSCIIVAPKALSRLWLVKLISYIFRCSHIESNPHQVLVRKSSVCLEAYA